MKTRIYVDLHQLEDLRQGRSALGVPAPQKDSPVCLSVELSEIVQINMASGLICIKPPEQQPKPRPHHKPKYDLIQLKIVYDKLMTPEGADLFPPNAAAELLKLLRGEVFPPARSSTPPGDER